MEGDLVSSDHHSAQRAFISLCKRPDGREDHDVLKYKIDTRLIEKSLASDPPPTILIGMKGIGKSTAFKILTSSADPSRAVGGFAPGAERFKTLPHVQPGLYRERFYVILLLTIMSLTTDQFGLSPNKKDQTLLAEVKKLAAPYLTLIGKNLQRLKGVGAFGFSATFDLTNEEHLLLDGFDRGIAERVLTLLRQNGKFVRIFVDDPEQSLPIGEQGTAALIGLLLAVNELNINSGGTAGAIVLLKSHVFQRVSGNEELSNILPTQKGVLSWNETELFEALHQRLEYAKCKYEEVFECEREEFRKTIIASLRNGPRDLFAWIAIAGNGVTTRKIKISDFETTRQALGQYSLGQITSAYGDSVKYVGQILPFIFPQQKWESLDELSARIIDLRTNNIEFIEMTKSNQLEYASDYVKFLLHAGALQVSKGQDVFNPFEGQYFDRLERKEGVRIALHPLLRAAVS